MNVVQRRDGFGYPFQTCKSLMMFKCLAFEDPGPIWTKLQTHRMDPITTEGSVAIAVKSRAQPSRVTCVTSSFFAHAALVIAKER